MIKIKFSDSIPGKADALVLCISALSKIKSLPLSKESQKYIADYAKRYCFTGKSGSSVQLAIPLSSNKNSNKMLPVLLVGQMTELSDIRTGAAGIATKLADIGAKSPALCFGDVATQTTSKAADQKRSVYLGHWYRGFMHGCYRYERYKKSKPSIQVKELAIVEPKPRNFSQVVEQSVVAGVHLARDLVNDPAEHATPKYLARIAKKVAGKHRQLSCTIRDKKWCREKKLNLFLAVSQGGPQAPYFIHMRYTPKKKVKGSKKICLIGKAVTFDSGGLSLKPTSNMLDMKSDMGGAATVLGTMQAIAQLGCDHQIDALMLATENMISGSAYRLGDVIRGHSGKTVEITNTDAEGRLTLADGLSYASKTFDPDEIIDLATLTGAVMVALGPYTAGLFSNDDGLAKKLLKSADHVSESLWRLPLSADLNKMMKSDIADLKNSGSRWGGSITAALFLQNFVLHKKKTWAHIDLAGPSYAESASSLCPSGGTGYGVETLISYLTSQ